MNTCGVALAWHTLWDHTILGTVAMTVSYRLGLPQGVSQTETSTGRGGEGALFKADSDLCIIDS